VTDIPRINDDALVERLRRAASAHDPVPPSVLEAGRRAYALGASGLVLADLVFDSLDDNALVGLRGDGIRQLTFATGDLTIDVDLEGDGGRVFGQTTDTEIRAVELQTPSTTLSLDVDGLGRFYGDCPSGRLCRLRILRPTGAPVVTEWFDL